MKHADGVRTATHTGDDRVRRFLTRNFGELGSCLEPDHALKLTHELRIWMRPNHGSDDVKCVIRIAHPVSDGLVGRVFQSLASARGGAYLRTEQLHPKHIQVLSLDVFGSHIHNAAQSKARADRRGGNTVLAGTGLGNNPLLTHAPRKQNLPDRIVDLVRTGMTEIFSF